MEKSGWGRSDNRGVHQGVAVHDFHHTLLAFVAEVSVSPAGMIRVHRVVCALDCGVAVNPPSYRRSNTQWDRLRTHGHTQGVYQHFPGGGCGKATLTTFTCYGSTKCRRVEVHIVPSTRAPTGIGEAAVPLIAPAVCNAVHAATGFRVRELPVKAVPRSV